MTGCERGRVGLGKSVILRNAVACPERSRRDEESLSGRETRFFAALRMTGWGDVAQDRLLRSLEMTLAGQVSQYERSSLP